MSSPLDAVFGKPTTLGYRLSIHSASGMLFANGNLSLQREQSGRLPFGKVSRHYAGDADCVIYPSGSDSGRTSSRIKADLLLRRTLPHYQIELWSSNKLWYSWSGDSNPYDDLFTGGKQSTISGMVGNWGSALFSISLP